MNQIARNNLHSNRGLRRLLGTARQPHLRSRSEWCRTPIIFGCPVVSVDWPFEHELLRLRPNSSQFATRYTVPSNRLRSTSLSADSSGWTHFACQSTPRAAGWCLVRENAGEGSAGRRQDHEARVVAHPTEPRKLEPLRPAQAWDAGFARRSAGSLDHQCHPLVAPFGEVPQPASA